jgi:tetratricopeptide (TPR) repeat protein
MIKKALSLLLFIITVFTNSFAQSTEFDGYIKEGVRLYDAGDYNSAIDQYQKALAIDSNSVIANYEIASTYFALKEYQKAIDYSDKVIQQKSQNGEQALILKGSALDILGKPDEAINAYKTGIIIYPTSHLLYFNLALTLYNSNGDKKEIEENLQIAVKLKPTHATSHLLLAYLMNSEKKRVQSLLALYNFLLLEPKGNRAAQAFKLLDGLLRQGVKRNNEKSTSITLFMDDKDKDEFSAAELMLSMLEASKTLDENKKKTDMELFTANTESFFAVLGELKKDNKGFWWNYYVDFFYAMKNKKMVETLCYYISQSQNKEDVNIWLTNNTSKTEELVKWSAEYDRK